MLTKIYSSQRRKPILCPNLKTLISRWHTRISHLNVSTTSKLCNRSRIRSILTSQESRSVSVTSRPSFIWQRWSKLLRRTRLSAKVKSKQEFWRSHNTPRQRICTTPYLVSRMPLNVSDRTFLILSMCTILWKHKITKLLNKDSLFQCKIQSNKLILIPRSVSSLLEVHLCPTEVIRRLQLAKLIRI